ncbi:hypothetical protein STH2780 [Symbiobacterium thermophilum IAM 14863]|uniref:Uncharacterized protein n=1 Tax=Symbiobacterium thermophilum (strain DSM 24528 / JCM 14929 / IAM 14863 / T) TaxID=292459 RepID=Q67KN3_SYMTH|nr:hypothetical protein STH2780 [Symbiobacterium thermophilum IAM 14863]
MASMLAMMNRLMRIRRIRFSPFRCLSMKQPVGLPVRCTGSLFASARTSKAVSGAGLAPLI